MLFWQQIHFFQPASRVVMEEAPSKDGFKGKYLRLCEKPAIHRWSDQFIVKKTRKMGNKTDFIIFDPASGYKILL